MIASRRFLVLIGVVCAVTTVATLLFASAGCSRPLPPADSPTPSETSGGASAGGPAADSTDTPTGTSGTTAGDSPTLATLQVFPLDNPWNQDISGSPVHPNSAAYIRSMGLDTGLHPDFGTVWDGAPIGIPYVVVTGDQAKVPITFYYGDESDPGPYPIPSNAPIEGGPSSTGDRHIIVLDIDHQRLYEVYDAHPSGGGWSAGSGAIFDLNSNALRPAGWTSADAAGLPIFPGLVRYDEVVERGEIRHALRFTVRRTQRAYISPARHFASNDTNADLPPMGLRVRLKASFDITPFAPHVQVILRALQKYGLLVADNGSDWYISGAPDARWDDDELHVLAQVTGRDFEAVYTGEPTTD